VAPTFSVVIPTHGRPALLREAIESVLSQTVGDLECIVVDDASDEAPAVPTDPRVRLVRRTVNGGPAAARNTGIEHASGRYVAFLDDDDVYAPGRLEAALAAHARAPVAVCWQATLGAVPPRPRGRLLEGRVGDVILDGMTPQVGATSVERAVVPRFDERYEPTEDVEWWIRLARDLPVATAPEVGLLYRVHQGPRARTGQRRRVEGGQALLDDYAPWFRQHRRAHAFRLKRIGLSALQAGDRPLARRYLTRSFRRRPEPKTAWHALRATVPRRQGPEPAPSDRS
jgi:glycosyltransferase involved in cell wall biosynthesis